MEKAIHTQMPGARSKGVSSGQWLGHRYQREVAKAEWRVETELVGHEPDLVIFADGKEIGCAQRLDDVVRSLVTQ